MKRYNKAKETDTKGEYKNLMGARVANWLKYHLDKGVKAYQDKKFDEAYKCI